MSTAMEEYRLCRANVDPGATAVDVTPFVPRERVNEFDFDYASCDYFRVKEDEVCKRGEEGYTRCLNSFRRRHKQCVKQSAWWDCRKDAERFELFCEME
jgi:hypothetical protein